MNILGELSDAAAWTTLSGINKISTNFINKCTNLHSKFFLVYLGEIRFIYFPVPVF